MYKFHIGRILITLFSCLVLQQYAVGQSIHSPSLTGKLKNGLTYYVQANPYPKGEAVYRLFLKTGSLAEKNAQRGLAHFLEHMAFNGTTHFPGDSLVRFLQKSGAQFGKDLNAHTSYDETVYKLQLPTMDSVLTKQAITILSDWAGRLELDSAAIEKERGIIFSEYLTRKAGDENVTQAYLDALMNGSRYSQRTVIGDTSIILHAPAQQIRDYYHDWYTPSLMAVAVVGDIDADWILEQIHQKFGTLPRKNKKSKKWPIPNYKESIFQQVIGNNEQQAELNIFRQLHLPKPVRTQKEYVSNLKSDLLRILIRRRISDLSFRNPAYNKISMQSSSFLNAKQVVIENVVLNPEKIDSSIIDFANSIAQIQQYGFTTDEIIAAKKLYSAQLSRKVSNNKPLNSIVIMDDIYNDFYKGQPSISPQQMYSWYTHVVDQVDSVAMHHAVKAWHKPAHAYYLLTAYPSIEKSLPSKEKIFNWFNAAHQTVQPVYQKPLQQVSMLMSEQPASVDIVDQTVLTTVDATQFTLANGVKVIFRKPVSDSKNITISGFRSGGLYSVDSSDYITGQYATQIIGLSGVKDINRESLSHFLTGKSASVRFLIDKMRTGISANSSIEDLELLMQLIYVKWTAPQVDTAMFKQIKESAIESLRHQNPTSSTAFEQALSDLINGTSYVTRPLTDTLVAQGLIHERILPIFNQAFGNANGYTFIVSADPSNHALRDIIIDYLGALPAGNDVALPYQYQRPVPQTDIFLERYDSDTEKATVSLTYQTNRLFKTSYDEHMLYSDVATAIIRTRLLKELREKMGKIYSISVSGSAGKYPSPMSRTSIRFSCKPEDAKLLIHTIQVSLQEMIDQPNTMVSTLKDVKLNMQKDMQLKQQKDSFWSSYIRNTLFNGDTLDFIHTFAESQQQLNEKEIANYIQQQIQGIKPIVGILYPKTYTNQN